MVSTYVAQSDLSRKYQNDVCARLNLQRGVGLTLKRHLISNGIRCLEDYQKGNAVLDILEINMNAEFYQSVPVLRSVNMSYMAVSLLK